MNTTIVPAQRTVEGGGFVVHRPFPVAALSHFDPFLLIDEMGPIEYAPGQAIGAPDHPHRGFETVTYIIEGGGEHEDSHGHRGTIGPGDVQWMTAGNGVIHSEMPTTEVRERGGRVHGFQIWINLPASLKMMQPRYQEYRADQLPTVIADGAWTHVIAGEVDGQRSPIETTVPTTLLHVRLDAGAEKTYAIAAGSNAIVYAITGNGVVNETPLTTHRVALISEAPTTLTLRAHADGLEALILAGVPLGEPVARYGPFVMNTRAQLQEAIDDFNAGRFGAIART